MTNLIELIEQHPNLPVYAWVDGEVCCGDDYACWLGEIGSAHKTKITQLERYYYDDNRVFEYEDKDAIWEYFADRDENIYKTDEEIWDMVESLPWKECILVFVGTPDSV